MFLTMLKNAFKSSAAFRMDFFLSILWPVTLMVINYFVWMTVTKGTLFNVLSYVATVWLATFFITNASESIARRIERGAIFFNLIRPVSMYKYFLYEQVTWKLTFLIPTLPVIAAICILAKLSPIIFLSFIFSFVISFNLSYIIGLSAAFTTHVFGTRIILNSLKNLLGGLFIPIMLFPPIVQRIAALLPFYYIYYAPYVALKDPFIIIVQAFVCLIFTAATILFEKLVVRKICVVGI